MNKTSPRVAVIGAGIVGLAAADGLCRAGAQVRLFEKATPGGAESIGLSRIFRQAHGDPTLVHLAIRARAGWRAWERRFGQHLLGEEGLIVTGEHLMPAWERAMREAGAPYQPLDAAEFAARLPIAQLPPSPALFDPAAGAIQARQTIDLLRASVAEYLVRGEVLEIRPTASGAQVCTVAETWACDTVLVTAGIATPSLAAAVGLSVPEQLIRHARFTFAPRTPHRSGVLACWIDARQVDGANLSAYALPDGAPGRYAVGVESGEGFPASLDMDDVSRLSLDLARRYLATALPGLNPEPIDEVRCTYNAIGFPDGDGFGALRRDAINVFYGNNLFKFAPLLGELLSQMALRQDVPAELMARASQASVAGLDAGA